jgi:hypothetical protein
MTIKYILGDLLPFVALATLAMACGPATEARSEESLESEQSLRIDYEVQGPTIGDLGDLGYKCIFSVPDAAWRCTKPGSTTYWCPFEPDGPTFCYPEPPPTRGLTSGVRSAISATLAE